MFQVKSAALSVSSNAALFLAKSAQLSTRLFAVEVVEEVEEDLVQDLLVEEDLEEVVLGHLEAAVDLVLQEVMVVLDHPVDMDTELLVDLHQEVVVDMEQTVGKDGLQPLQEEVQEGMEEDPDIVVDQVEDLEEIVGILEVVEVEDLVAAVGVLEEMEGD